MTVMQKYRAGYVKPTRLVLRSGFLELWTRRNLHPDRSSENISSVLRVVLCDFVDRLSLRPNRTIHEITRNNTNRKRKCHLGELIMLRTNYRQRSLKPPSPSSLYRSPHLLAEACSSHHVLPALDLHGRHHQIQADPGPRNLVLL